MIHAVPFRQAMDTFRLAVPGTIDQRPLVIQFILSACRAYTVPIEVEHSVLSALGEAFNNVCMHSYRDVDGEVAIEIELERGHLVVRLRDRGAAFDPSTVRPPDLEALPERGLGLYIMLRAMDDVQWYQKDGENVVALAKRLAG
jgi:serine/threonine-protein kinase RsbW